MNALDSSDLNYALTLIDRDMAENRRTRDLLTSIPSVRMPQHILERLDRSMSEMQTHRQHFSTALQDAIAIGIAQPPVR